MFVTLDVSKLSGWLKADAPCRVERRAYDAERGAGREAGGGGRPRRHAACIGELNCRLGTGHGKERTSNMLRMVVTLEVFKLSGWLNANTNCRESKRRAYGAGRGAAREAGGRRVTAVHAAYRGGLDCRSGARHGEERTRNM